MVVIVSVFGDLSVEVWIGVEGTPSPAVETSAPTQAQETAPPGAEEVDIPDLKVGDCVAESLFGVEGIFTVETVPCSEPHSEEIYAVATLPEGDFPGVEAAAAQADKLCAAEFESFVGLPYRESVLYYSYLHPDDEETWIAIDRLVTCSVFDPDGDTTGTLADANR
jgi:hypothetical protein